MAPNVMRENNSGLDYVKLDNNSKKAVILYHGFGASMMDLFDLGHVINTKESYDWIFPNGLLEVNLGYGMLGRGWFPVDMAALDEAMRKGEPRDFSGEQTKDFVHAVEKGMTFFNSIADEYDEVVIGGFSQGSMLASYISVQNNPKLKGLICYSGTLVGRDALKHLLGNSNKFPFMQSHGTHDPVLGIQQAQNQYDLFKDAGFSGEFIEFPGAHEIPMNVINKTADFLNSL